RRPIMDRPRRDSRQHNGITVRRRSQPTFATKSAVFGNWHPQTATGLVAATIVYLFVWDFFQYWFHRAVHASALLWPVHALHHDDENVNWSTSQRTTIWSVVIVFFSVNLPTVMICGLQLLPLAAAYVFFKGFGLFNHANIRINLGPLTPVISGPQFHRLHHGRDGEYFDKNFAAFFPVIDIIFGTYRKPLPDEYPATGLSDRGPATLSLVQILRATLGMAADQNANGAAEAASQTPVATGI
ncbi:MAG: sterol desaturase family protein, partial [Xanthobacteraceae bacterium]